MEELQRISSYDEFDLKKQENVNILYDIMRHYSSNHQIQLSILNIIENSLNSYINEIYKDGNNHDESIYFTHFHNKFMEKFFYIFLVNKQKKSI